MHAVLYKGGCSPWFLHHWAVRRKTLVQCKVYKATRVRHSVKAGLRNGMEHGTEYGTEYGMTN